MFIQVPVYKTMSIALEMSPNQELVPSWDSFKNTFNYNVLFFQVTMPPIVRKKWRKKKPTLSVPERRQRQTYRNPVVRMSRLITQKTQITVRCYYRVSINGPTVVCC